MSADPTPWISSPAGVLAVLCAVAAFFFLLAEVTASRLFNYLPPLLFIYATPVVLNNSGVIPADTWATASATSFQPCGRT